MKIKLTIEQQKVLNELKNSDYFLVATTGTGKGTRAIKNMKEEFKKSNLTKKIKNF